MKCVYCSKQIKSIKTLSMLAEETFHRVCLGKYLLENGKGNLQK